jgi:two-component system, NarL family, sensor kinase
MREEQQRLRLIHGTSQRPPETEPTSPASAAIIAASSSDRPPGDLTVALRASEQRLSALLQDRGRIGRDLHDCVLQSLYAIGLSLEHARRLAPKGPPSSRRASPDHAVDQLNGLIQDIRRMIHGLEHGTVEKFDLCSELKSLVATYSRVGDLNIAMDLQPAAVEILTGEEERDILNIVREALSNCARHAQANQAAVKLHARGTRVRLTISDNGTGFDPTETRTSGYGLANMAARAKKLGGQLTIRSQRGRGTRIVAEFALEPILTPV